MQRSAIWLGHAAGILVFDELSGRCRSPNPTVAVPTSELTMNSWQVYTVFAASVLAGNSVLRSLFGTGKPNAHYILAACC